MRSESSLNRGVLKDLSNVDSRKHLCCARTELLTLVLAHAPMVDETGLTVKTNDVLLAQRLLHLCRDVLGRSHPVKLHQSPSSTPGRHRIEVSIASFEDLRTDEHPLSLARRLAAGPPCCAAAFLRALYWKGGYLSSPKRGFHVELVLPRSWPTDIATTALSALSLELRHLTRRGRTVLYAKAAQTIVDLFGQLGATMTVLLLQDVIITKELKNDVNRDVNAEVGNLRRSSVSSAADVEAVRLLRNQGLLEKMPDKLRAVADVRCRYPGLSLKELGLRLEPPLTKAGVFHRLRQLRKEAEFERKRLR